VNIFTRSLDDNLASLVKQVDEVVAANKDKQMASFVVLLTDDPDEAESQLKAFADKHGIKVTPLTMFDGPAGPEKYNIAKEADVTVHLWVGPKEVKANHAFAKGKLDAKGIAAIISDTGKILN
jgi:hypothetical protein